MTTRHLFLALTAALCCLAAPLPAQPLHIGFIDPALPKETPARNAAALAFARTQGTVTRLQALAEGGWNDAAGRPCAPEEFDVVWYHQAEGSGLAALGRAACADLRAYLESGGVLLLSGAAGDLLNEMDVESTPLRVLGPTGVAFASGIVVPEQHRAHPAFAGLEVTRPLLLTSRGGNALADFYGTAGPHGELLAEGNAGMGERPLVEYTVGAGRVILVGWRLADFTTDQDAYRPNLERLFANLLRYLAGRNTNHARLAVPPGESRYVRVFGMPFLRAPGPVTLTLPAGTARYAAILTREAGVGESFPAGDVYVQEIPLQGQALSVQALGLTLLQRERPVAQYVAAGRATQAEFDARDRELTRGLKILRPAVTFTPAPLKPTKVPDTDRSVLLGRSPFMAPDEGRGDATPVYEPVEDGGFRITGGPRRLNRPIIQGQNRVWTGDVPLFRMDTTTGNGSYSENDRAFPLWPRPDGHIGNVDPCFGTLRLGVPGADGQTQWFEELPGTTALFRPGYTDYQVTGPGGAWKASVTIAPLLDSHGLVCRIEFDKETPLVWQYGGVWWQESEANANRVEVIGEREARITEPNLPNGLVAIGCDTEGPCRAIPAPYGQQVEFTAKVARKVYHVVATWGVTKYDEERAKQTMARLDTPASEGWKWARDILKRAWFDCYIGRALRPDLQLAAALLQPESALKRTRDWWDARRAEFQIRTPDAHLNALVNWTRCTSEYHRRGPGLILGLQMWHVYAHISTGWYGKQWGGDHAAIEECLRLYGAMQDDNGFIRWISPSLVAFPAENNTPYWVDQVWRHYTWTGDRQFVRELWPLVRKAVAWQRRQNDPDGDGLFRDAYEYWNCDSNGKGPKAAAPSAMSWAMLDRAARMAAVVGDATAEKEYRALAEQTRQAIFRELWRDDVGLLGSIGADGLWRGHPQIWEEYLAVNAGLLRPEQGQRALRWLEQHYGFEPRPGVHLLACSDWWPIRWSTQWVPTGDTCLAVLAGALCGDTDRWWPYLQTAVRSSFRSDFPGINMGIANTGAGGGDREDVDSVDPFLYATIRGLFGIEPALHEGALEIRPAFPSDWEEASIRTPDVSYEYRREGERITLRIRTPKPLVKRVRAGATGREVVTRAEAESVVTLRQGKPALAPVVAEKPQVLVESGEAAPEAALGPGGAGTAARLPEADRERQVLLDLAGACNVTLEEFAAVKFQFDYADHLAPIGGWWGNPTLAGAPQP
ncbi:MAG: hypothetical protein GX774_16955, partial [Armatimonadetes bacterium]|nr:hypothetical protein [Armatimonadota bacterium]